MNYLPIFFYNRVKNVGDQVNHFLIEKITDTPLLFSDQKSNHILGVGSILNSANENSYIWGSGFMFDKSSNDNIDIDKILVLRGKKTYEALFENKLKIDVPLGDPAYLLPDFMNNLNNHKKKYKYGFIPHYVDFFNPILMDFIYKNDDSIKIDVALPANTFLNLISECEFILSSSLHGLIFAESLRVPNYWVEFSNFIAGDRFKFKDWYSICNNKISRPFLLKTKKSFQDLKYLTHHSCFLAEPNISKKEI